MYEFLQYFCFSFMRPSARVIIVDILFCKVISQSYVSAKLFIFHNSVVITLEKINNNHVT